MSNNVPAFPSTEYNQDGSVYCYNPGMSLLDYFAAKAMHAMIVNQLDCSHEVLAARSYMMAKAMLAARKQYTGE